MGWIINFIPSITHESPNENRRITYVLCCVLVAETISLQSINAFCEAIKHNVKYKISKGLKAVAYLTKTN